MSTDFSFTARKSEKGYVFIAQQYGVVVWTSDVATGIKELEARVEGVATQLREAGVEPETITSDQPNSARYFGVSLWPFFIKTAVLGMFVVVLGLWLVIPLANAFLAKVQPTIIALQHPAQLITRLSDKIEQIPPGRLDELKVAIGKISAKARPLIEAAGMKTTSSTPLPVQNGNAGRDYQRQQP